MKSPIIAQAQSFFGVRAETVGIIYRQKARQKRSAPPHDSATTTAARPVAKARQGLRRNAQRTNRRDAVALVFSSKFEAAYRQETTARRCARGQAQRLSSIYTARGGDACQRLDCRKKRLGSRWRSRSTFERRTRDHLIDKNVRRKEARGPRHRQERLPHMQPRSESATGPAPKRQRIAEAQWLRFFVRSGLSTKKQPANAREAKPSGQAAYARSRGQQRRRKNCSGSLAVVRRSSDACAIISSTKRPGGPDQARCINSIGSAHKSRATAPKCVQRITQGISAFRHFVRRFRATLCRGLFV